MAIEERMIEQRQQVAADLAIEAQERRPNPSGWALFSADDSAGFYQWYDTRGEMLDFVSEHLTWLGESAAVGEGAHVAAGVRSIVERVRAGHTIDDQSRDEINSLMDGYSQLMWWGPVSELISGDTEFTRERRWDFFSSEDEEFNSDLASVPPIPSGEIADFLEMLKGSGY